MCCIFGFIKWSFGCVHRTLTFILTAWLVLMIVYVCGLAIVAGIAYGYDYCLAEFATLSRSNVKLEVKPKEHGEDLVVGRTGNIVDLMAEGKEYRVRPKKNKVKSAKKHLPQWLFKPHRRNTTSSKKKEMGTKETKMHGLTDTAINFRKEDLKFMPFRYLMKSNRTPTTEIAETDEIEEEETEMDYKKDESDLLAFIHARSTEQTEVDEDVTETHEEEADLKLMPHIYAKWFSHHTTRNSENVNMGKEDTEIYEKKTDVKLPPSIVEQFDKLANLRVSSNPTQTTKETENEEESVEYQKGTNMVTNSDSSTLASTAYIWKSTNPDMTTTLSTRPTRSSEMRWFIPKSTRMAWRLATSDTFFYITNKDDLGKTTKRNPYNPEMKIRVFDRPNYGKSLELPAMRHWDTITRALESSTSNDNMDYKKLIYF